MKKGLNAFYQCRNSIGNSWGLPPTAIRWMYLAIVRTVITYSCVVWWSALDRSFQRKILDKVQRIASLSITSEEELSLDCFDIMLCLTPLDLCHTLDRSLQSSERHLS